MLPFVRATGLFTLLSLACEAAATTYMAPLDQADWKVEQTKLNCQLRQPIPRYGEAVFEARAGGQVRFFLTSNKQTMQAGPTQLVANAPFWNPDMKPESLGSIEVADGQRAVQVDNTQALQLLQALNAGLAPELSRPSIADEAVQVRVALSPVRFRKAYGKYQDCTAKLPQVSFEQISRTVLEFGNQETKLSAAARGRLDQLLNYAKGEGVTLVVDALSADTPRRLDNIELAKQRVQEVTSYLVGRGVAQQRIVGNYRGERGRQKRAVVTVQLKHKGE